MPDLGIFEFKEKIIEKVITLANLAEATEQEIFDQVAKHLLKQNEQSYDKSSNSCVYRGKNGLKCAAGCLISNEEFEESNLYRYNTNSWVAVIGAKIAPSKHSGFIQELQNIHDNSETTLWPEKLKMLCNRRNLEWKFGAGGRMIWNISLK